MRFNRQRQQEVNYTLIVKNLTKIASINLICIIIISYLFPKFLPFTVFELWNAQGTVIEWLIVAWPIFAWGVGVTACVSFLTKNNYIENIQAEKIFGKNIIISFLAGVFEEISFRWIFFLGALVGVQVINFLFFGFLGFGLTEWLYIHVFGPIANFLTFGKIEFILFHKSGWMVGAALLSTNAKFRNGHISLGPIGYINSWFLGMFWFWMTFKYGLLASIITHFVYDFLIFCIQYIDSVFERFAMKREGERN
ncbi:MAG: hypothetical protein HYW78_02070 [Parcubacteria group bacterium]|nr:hypothetical protein [Parcubacteria group bacterium]